ncbi:MAG: hypothetical protein IPL28_22810 [Chloroflexi bacterium]|nr:hypothetical protein [Chloroflexota bacterium]
MVAIFTWQSAQQADWRWLLNRLPLALLSMLTLYAYLPCAGRHPTTHSQ